MDESVVIEEVVADTPLDKFAKVILGTGAAFLAQRIVENVYDNLIKARRNR